MAVVEAQSRFHVLAVDDSLMDRKLIERLLKTSSFQVTTVDSGSKALEFLVSPSQQEIEVNLIITDYCMPGMTGYDLLKKIKESSYLKNIPVVIMSSENVPSRINRCLEEGAEEFILKPVQLSDMNRLKPHLLKGKSKEEKKEQQKQQEILINETRGDSTNGFSIKQQQQLLLVQMKEGNENIESTKKSTKRKAMDEGSFPEKSRPRLE